MKLEHAAQILVAHIMLLSGPEGLSSDEHRELQEAVDAFREVDEILEKQRPC